MNKRVGIYVRVSSQEQKLHGLSVDNQIAALSEYCVANGYTVAGIYNDAGISARKKYTNRPALLKLMSDASSGALDLIIFTKLDRWFRSVADYYAVQAVLDDAGVPWRAIWEDYDTETSAGVFKVNIMLSVAQAEADRTSERIKSVLDYKRERGDYVGCVPAGYVRKNGKLEKDEARAHEIEETFRFFLLSDSIRKTCEHLASLGYNISLSGVQRRLKNELYCGGPSGDLCAPYISRETYERILQNLSSRTRAPKVTHGDYVFSGLIRCKYCGCKLAAHTQPNRRADGSIAPCRYYVCRGKDNIKKHAAPVQISENFLQSYLLQYVDELVRNYNFSLGVAPDGSDAKEKIKALKAKLSRVGDRYELGDITLDEFKTKREVLLAEIKNLEAQLSPRRELILPDNWSAIYNDLDDLHRRAFWKSFIDYVEVSRENKNAPDLFFYT